VKKISILLVIIMLFSAATVVGCAQDAPAPEPADPPPEPASGQEGLLIGFAQLGTTDRWRIAQTNSMITEAENRGFNLIMTDAQDSTAKQVSDVEDLIAQGIDYLFLSPIEYEGLVPALEAANRAGVPVILIDRAARGEAGVDYVTMIVADFIWEGEQAAHWLADALGETGRIVELTGTVGASVAIDRANGFYQGLENYPNMEIISSQTADFNRAEAQRVMENIILSVGTDFDAVYTHADEMAFGAILAMKAAGIDVGRDGVLVVGIDGGIEAIESVIAGDLAATITCSPLFGPVAFDTLQKIINGESVPPLIINPGTVIDIRNAEAELPNSF